MRSPRAKRDTSRPPGWRAGLLLGLAALVLWAAGVALIFENARLADEGSGKLLAVFGPGVTQETGFQAIAASGGAPVRPVLGGFAWVAHSDAPGFAGRLKRNGAVAAYGEIALSAGPMLAGCVAWVRHRASGLPPRITP